MRYTDPELVAMIRSGEPRAERNAITFIWRRQIGSSIRYVRANSGRAEDGEDTLSMAIVALCKNIRSGSYQPRAGVSMAQYLQTIVRFTWLKTLRGRPEGGEVPFDQVGGLDEVYSALDEEALLANAQWELFERAVLTLNEWEQQFITDCRKGYSSEKLAQKHRLPSANAAKMRKHLIVVKLRKFIQDNGL